MLKEKTPLFSFFIKEIPSIDPQLRAAAQLVHALASTPSSLSELL